MKSEPFLLVRNIEKVYPSGFRALELINLEVQKGEFLTLLGPSGSGKTTLLNIIVGGLFPTAGEVVMGGRDITRLPSRDRNLGMVFQNYALLPHLNVFNNIAFPLRIRKVRKADIQSRVQEALDTVQLGEFGERFPRQLSGGQQQRVAIARCLVYRPDMILMDEPLGALDRNLREQMQFEIRRIHAETGVTIIYVTHDQEEALTMSDRICLMSDGEIAEIGAPASIYSEPTKRFTAEFLGGANIFEAKCVEAPNSMFEWQGGKLSLHTRWPVNQGEKLNWMVRPERIKRAASEEVGDCNIVLGIVTDVALSGNTTKYRLDIGMSSFLSFSELTSTGGEMLKVGDKTSVCWSKEAAVALRS